MFSSKEELKLVVLIIAAVVVLTGGAHILSYYVLKKRIVSKKKWDLNICCGTTDGGGMNADIREHIKLPNFDLIDDIYILPYKDNQ